VSGQRLHRSRLRAVEVGVVAGGGESTVRRLAADVAKARSMSDPAGKMGVNLKDAGGEALAVSQFTLLADFSKGNRPSFNGAARPEIARPLFDLFVTELSAHLGHPRADRASSGPTCASNSSTTVR
jgi:D-tyrosyl-tRNA(Tyr) deacylase